MSHQCLCCILQKRNVVTTPIYIKGIRLKHWNQSSNMKKAGGGNFLEAEAHPTT